MAAVVALPVMLYQTLMFIRPALETPQELAMFRAVAILGMPLVLFFFAMGLFFAYFVMLPFGLKYLLSFGSELAKAELEHQRILFVRVLASCCGSARPSRRP